MIPKRLLNYVTRIRENIAMLRTKKKCFKNFFFPSSKDNTVSLASFKSNLLKFIRPISNFIHDIHNSKGILLLTKLRLELSYLRDHKFGHNF